MITLNPNRFLTKGVERSSFIDLDGNVRLISNELVDYIYSKLNQSTKCKVTIEDFETFLSTEMFFVSNAINYQAPLIPYDVSILIVKADLFYDELYLTRFINSLIVGQILFKITSKNLEEQIFLVKRIFKVLEFTECILLFDNNVFVDINLLQKISDINNLSEIYISNSIELDKTNHFNFDVFQKKRNLEPKIFLDFNPNINQLIESELFNTFLNKKIFVSNEGQLKLSEDFSYIFGSIQNKDVDSYFLENLFIYWELTKSKIDICKDCEFRRICIDFREPFKRNSNSSWYNKHECGYNPFICKWEDEEGYRTLAECGVISNEHEFSIDHEKIALINKELWGDE
jgi:hypothetical protein